MRPESLAGVRTQGAVNSMPRSSDMLTQTKAIRRPIQAEIQPTCPGLPSDLMFHSPKSEVKAEDPNGNLSLSRK
jgi:hypothetical protein